MSKSQTRSIIVSGETKSSTRAKKQSKEKPKPMLVIFTDGSCSQNGKKTALGGIGIHFPNGELADISKIYSRGPCTNQKTELYAILSALRYVHQYLGLHKYHVLIKTDSNYSINCITKWIHNWIANGWVNSKGEPVANKDIIESIHKFTELYDIELEHVSAHTNSEDPDSVGNNMADILATNATKRAIEESRKTDTFQSQKQQLRRGKSSNSRIHSKFRKNVRSGVDDIEVELING